jgi:hypothetical protein
MKRSIIILIALVLIISLPVFASTPEEENAPTATSEDGMFLDMTQLSEEELNKILGNIVNSGTQPDIFQEAGTQGRDEALITLAMYIDACRKYWNPKINKIYVQILFTIYVRLPLYIFTTNIPQSIIDNVSGLLSSIGIEVGDNYISALISSIIQYGANKLEKFIQNHIN